MAKKKHRKKSRKGKKHKKWGAVHSHKRRVAGPRKKRKKGSKRKKHKRIRVIHVTAGVRKRRKKNTRRSKKHHSIGAFMGAHRSIVG